MADDRLTPPFVRGHDHALGDGGPVPVLFGDCEGPGSAAHQGVQAERVLDDVRSAVDSGAPATPALFIEDARWDGGWEPEALGAALRAALAG